MTPISPDLQQNLAITAELTILHNYWAIFCFFCLCASLLWSLWKPSRAATLAILGFGLLLFSFEYTKHILEPLKNQTLSSVITVQEHLKARRILNASLIKLIPFGSQVVGWSSLVASAVLMFKAKNKQKIDNHSKTG